MTWPTKPHELRKLAREYHDEADDMQYRIPFIEDEDLPAHLEDIKFLREMAAEAYSRIPKDPEPQPKPRILILGNGWVIGQGEASSL
jgi:hypothetical protein